MSSDLRNGRLNHRRLTLVEILILPPSVARSRQGYSAVSSTPRAIAASSPSYVTADVWELAHGEKLNAYAVYVWAILCCAPQIGQRASSAAIETRMQILDWWYCGVEERYGPYRCLPAAFEDANVRIAYSDLVEHVTPADAGYREEAILPVIIASESTSLVEFMLNPRSVIISAAGPTLIHI